MFSKRINEINEYISNAVPFALYWVTWMSAINDTMYIETTSQFMSAYSLAIQ